MDIYVLDDRLSICGVIDQWESLIWNRKLREAGSFELEVAFDDTYALRYLLPQHYIALPTYEYVQPYLYDLGYITTIQDQNDGEKRTVLVSGYTADGIFRKRLFPFSVPTEKLKNMNLIDLLGEISSLGCRIKYNFAIDPDLTTIPADYMMGNMEDCLRYLCTRDAEESDSDYTTEYTLHAYLGYTPYDDSTDWDDVHPYLYVLIEPITNTLYPLNIFSEETDNFENATYSFSEEDCYSVIHVRVDPDFSVSVTEETGEVDEDGNAETTTTTVTYADVELSNMPSYDYDVTTVDNNYQYVYSSSLSRSEKLIYIDPVIVKGQKREYGTAQWIKSDVPLGNCVLRSDGTQYLVMPSEMVDTWSIDYDKTLEAMKTAAKEAASIGTENFTGRMSETEITSRNRVILGSIVLVRDDKRQRDFYKRVEEIEEVWDSSGHSYQPTFGEPLKNIYDLINER